LVDTWSAEYSKRELLTLFAITQSTYYAYQWRKNRVDTERERLKVKVIDIHQTSRQSAGSRTIMGQMKQQGESIGRYKVRRLMQEAKLTSKQPGKHRYKPATKPSDVAENHLNRQFTVEQPNQVWCGDVTYIGSGTQWLYFLNQYLNP
jgi:putative transposase